MGTTVSKTEIVFRRALNYKRLNGAGFRVEAQKELYRHFVDFAFMNRKDGRRLIVEIDGKGHRNRSQKRNDECRDAIFARLGFETLRITDEQVLYDARVCVLTVEERLKNLTKHTHTQVAEFDQFYRDELSTWRSFHPLRLKLMTLYDPNPKIPNELLKRFEKRLSEIEMQHLKEVVKSL